MIISFRVELNFGSHYALNSRFLTHTHVSGCIVLFVSHMAKNVTRLSHTVARRICLIIVFAFLLLLRLLSAIFLLFFCFFCFRFIYFFFLFIHCLFTSLSFTHTHFSGLLVSHSKWFNVVMHYTVVVCESMSVLQVRECVQMFQRSLRVSSAAFHSRHTAQKSFFFRCYCCVFKHPHTRGRNTV